MKKILSLVLGFIIFSCSSGSESTNQEEYAAFEDQSVTDQKSSENIIEPIAVKNTAHFHTVEIKRMKFVPAELTIQKGDTVMWINKDFVLHDVTEENNKSWTSSSIAIGRSWSKVVTESTDYFCSLHLIMKGKLLVK